MVAHSCYISLKLFEVPSNLLCALFPKGRKRVTIFLRQEMKNLKTYLCYDVIITSRTPYDTHMVINCARFDVSKSSSFGGVKTHLQTERILIYLTISWLCRRHLQGLYIRNSGLKTKIFQNFVLSRFEICLDSVSFRNNFSGVKFHFVSHQ